MSNYEWERGEFRIPAAEWAGFKASVREAVNRQNALAFDAALKLHQKLTEKAKGNKSLDLRQAAWDEMATINVGSYYTPPKFCEDEVFEIVESVIKDKRLANGRTQTRLAKPTKKDFPQHGNNVTAFRSIGCSLVLDNGSRTAVWNVSENNHAVDSARATALAKGMFAALGKVKWTRGTGGVILGNNEYHSDSGRYHEGGGGSFSKESFGPDKKLSSRPAPSMSWSFRR